MDWRRIALWAFLTIVVVAAVLLIGRVAVLAFRSHKPPAASAPPVAAPVAERRFAIRV